MQNVLLAFSNKITSKQVAEIIGVLFQEVQNHSSEPDRYVLIKDDDAIFLRTCSSLKENYEEWFEQDQYDLVMSLESFIEMQYRNLNTARVSLKILCREFESMTIIFDDSYFTSAEFLARLEIDSAWDWR